MLTQPIETLEEADIQRLVDNQVTEGRTIEFKRDQPGGSDDERKEFLADVTSFANAQGGDLIFGVDAPKGTAKAMPGVEVDDTDAASLRLENMLRDGVAPRVVGLRVQWVPLASGRQVLVMRIPAGLAAPHRVEFKNSRRFYNRTSAGKYEMDVHELRHAFTEAGALPQRFRELHRGAIGMCLGIEMPISVTSDPRAVVSVIPLSLFREAREIPVTREYAIAPVKSGGYSMVDMIEGVLAHTSVPEDGFGVRSFAMTYREGRADIAWAIGGLRDIDGKTQHLVFWKRFEEGLLEATRAAQSRLKHYGVEGPWVVFVTVFAVKGYFMLLADGDATNEAYKDEALLGELRLDTIDEDALLPVVKNFWLLFGERRPEGVKIGGQ